MKPTFNVYLYNVLFNCFDLIQNILVNQDASTVFANDYFFARRDIHLTLWWNFVEATTTGITLNGHNSQSITCIFANAFEGS